MPGATVEADRFVGSSEASRQVSTAADGSWTIPAILGGRYRVRAWQSPSLAMTTPQIFFLGGTQAMAIDLQVQAFTGQAISSAANPTSTAVGDDINVVVAVSTQSVNASGIVSYQPAAGRAGRPERWRHRGGQHQPGRHRQQRGRQLLAHLPVCGELDGDGDDVERVGDHAADDHVQHPLHRAGHHHDDPDEHELVVVFTSTARPPPRRAPDLLISPTGCVQANLHWVRS